MHDDEGEKKGLHTTLHPQEAVKFIVGIGIVFSTVTIRQTRKVARK